MEKFNLKITQWSKGAITLLLTLITLTACGGNEKKNTDSETVCAPEVCDTVAAPEFSLTSEGVGPVRTGMKVGSWPSAVEELYDRVESSDGGDANQYEFYFGDRPMLTVLDFGENKADLIIVSDPAVKAAVGDKRLGLGDSFRNLLESDGVTADFQSYDEEGMWYWHADGLWFAPEQESLPENLAKKLYDDRQKPIISDFPENVGIGYIGTGLPF